MSVQATIAKGAGAISGIVGIPAAAIGIHKYATSLYEVENSVIEKEVKLTASAASSTNVLTIKAEANTDTTTEAKKLPKDHSWSCEITLTKKDSGEAVNEASNLATTPLTTKLTNLDNSKRRLLVEACSKNRKDGATHKSVVGRFTVTVTEVSSTKTYSFSGYKELDDLLKTS